jgi:hypothetical protein
VVEDAVDFEGAGCHGMVEDGEAFRGGAGKRWRVWERCPRSPETRASAGEEIDEAADQ